MAHTVDRYAPELQVLNHADQARQAAGIRRAVVVDEQLGTSRRILPGRLQRDVNVALPKDSIEGTLGEAIGLARVERFVHHVPHIDFARSEERRLWEAPVPR